jgi:hypothetical protein
MHRPMKDEHLLKAAAVGCLVLGIAGLVLGMTEVGPWVRGSSWSVAYVIAAAAVISGVPKIWRLAEAQAEQRSSRLIWVLATGLHATAGVAATGAAIGNELDEWAGGVGWTVVLSLLAAYSLLNVLEDLAHMRR